MLKLSVFPNVLAGQLPDVEFVAVDMATDESVKEGLDHVKKIMATKSPRVFIHLAAYYSFDAAESSNYDRIAVKGTSAF